MTDKVQKIREEVERLRNLHQIKYQNLDTNDNMCLVECGKRNLCNELLSFIDTLQEEPVSEDLEAAACQSFNSACEDMNKEDKDAATYLKEYFKELWMCAFRDGAKWQKQQMMKSAKLDGWIARDEDDRLHLFEVEPRRLEKEHRWWDRDYHRTGLDESDFPDLKWEDEPIYVKLIIIKED